MKYTKSNDGIYRATIKIEFRFTQSELFFWRDYLKECNYSLKLRDYLYSSGHDWLFHKLDEMSSYDFECEERKIMKKLSKKYNVYKDYFE